MPPYELVEDFARLVQGIQGIEGLWAIVDHGRLHFHTLVGADDRGTLDELFGAELAFMDAWDEPPVVFHVTTDAESLKQQLKDAPSVLTPA